MSEHPAGHEETYGDFGPAGEYQAGYAGEHADAHAAYEDVAYGDEGPSHYAEDVAYGDEGPSGYSDDVAYGDEGPHGYVDDVAYGDEGAHGHAENAGAAAAAAPRRRKGKKGKGKARSKRGKARGKAGAGDPKRRRMLLIGGLGLAIMGLLGASGYYVLAMSQGAGQPGFDVGSLMRMLPFGAKDTDATIASDQNNLTQVRAAVEAFAREHGQLPGTAEAIAHQLALMHQALKNPYQANGTPHITLGSDPGAPGAIAYALTHRGYTLQVGDANGKPLAVSGVPVVMMGLAPKAPMAQAPKVAATAPHPAPHPTESTAGETPTPAGKLPVKMPSAPADEAPVPPAPDVAQAPAPKTRPSRPEPEARAAPSAASHRGTPRQSAPQGAAPLPMATPTPPSPYVGPRSPVVQRNQRFDHWRIEGITLVREQKTKESLDAFKRALALRPDDATVQRWVGVIQDVIDKHTAEEKAKYEQAKAEMLKSLKTPMVSNNDGQELPVAKQINEVDPSLLPKIPNENPAR